ncbi:MAG: succinate dehydrogenase cytochrome b subunit [Leptospiraceae bacterium]|nr:succinate dehydrogenase cytochrome b subunit [Leptospiraceae bacterium]
MNALAKPPASKIQPKGIFQTSVGKKIIIAITGIFLIGFVFGHMLGHLQMFVGQDKYNSYAKMLKDLGPLLWIIRIVLLAFFVIHIKFAIQVTLENKKARPVPYYNQKTQVASLASRTMAISGIIILAFVIYHLLHFTLHATHPEYANMVDSQGRPDVYGMMIAAFHSPLLLSSYLVAVGLLCFHLSHGIFSVLQTLGLNHPKIDRKVKVTSTALAAFLFIGYASVPLAIFLNIIQ